MVVDLLSVAWDVASDSSQLGFEDAHHLHDSHLWLPALKSSFLFSPVPSATRPRHLVCFSEETQENKNDDPSTDPKPENDATPTPPKFGPEAEKKAEPDKPAGTPVEVHGLRSRLVETETAVQAPRLHEVDWAVPGGGSPAASTLSRKLASLEKRLAVGPDVDGVGTGRPSIAPWEKPKPVCAGCPQPCPCRNGANLKPWQLATICRAYDGDQALFQSLSAGDGKVKNCFDKCSPAELGCPNPPLPWWRGGAVPF